ncbi:ABC transporter ATP-binding protein [Paenibacillus paridis]|uniref:ABC transporter ATP-binding protein n=1 Tax=Paenibacillus paridis TaxID=2583376 RepID=UPI00111F932B|nr:ABC transporter ATP-binding protein [Paenibacillus paridis]
MRKKTGLARLLELAGERKGLLWLAAVLSTISALLMLVPYASVYFIVKELLEHAANPALADGGYMIRYGSWALVALLGSLAAMYGGGMASHIAAFRILYGLRMKLATHIGKLPLGWLNGTSTGSVKKTLDSNVEKVEGFVAHQLPDFVQVVVTTIVMISVMFYLNVWLALVCLVPIMLGITAQVMMMRSVDKGNSIKHYYDYLQQMNGSAVQYVRGMPAIKVFGQTVHSFRKFHADMVSYREYCVKYTDQFQNGFLLFKVLLSSFAAFALPVGVFLLDRNPGSTAFAAVLLFFLIMSPGLTAPMFKMMSIASSLRDINEGVKRIDLILAEEPIKETGTAQSPSSYSVKYEKVSFSYQAETSATRKEALSNISFEAKQGKVTALVGPSGSGKSTVASLLPRFWDIQQGKISIGNMDIREMQTHDLMETVAFVFQDSFLFYDTLYNNIAVGNPDASRGQVYAAAQAAQCHAFIDKLPLGYDTLIGEGGVYLSGGEEQRVAVARAILKNAPVLVLDEATAFADPENEYEMQLALKELMKGKTVIVIAHRLSSIVDADQIIVLNNGEIAEKGTHEALIAKGRLYSQMWEAYSNASQWQMGRGGVSV